MPDSLIVCAPVFAAFVWPLYIFIMRRLSGPQRFFVFALIGGLPLALSFLLVQGLPAHTWPDHLLPSYPGMYFFIAFVVGWLVCGFLHAIGSLLRRKDSKPHVPPAQD